MADPRFFDRSGPFTLAQLAATSGATLAEGVDPERQIEDVAPLERAGPGDLGFLDNRKYRAAFAASAAGACVTRPQFAEEAPDGMALLLSDNPYKSYALIAPAAIPGLIGGLG